MLVWAQCKRWEENHLAVVISALSINGASPENTTNVGGGWWVGAVGARSKSWITLEVDVEAGASLVSVTLGGASVGVVAVEVGVGDVRVSGVSGVQVLEDLLVARWSLGGESSLAESWKSDKSRGGVWLWDWAGAQWLDITLVVLWWRHWLNSWCRLRGGGWLWLAWLRLGWLGLGATGDCQPGSVCSLR